MRPLPVGLQLLTARIDFDGLNKMGIAAAVFALGVSHCNIRWEFVAKIVCLVDFSCGMLRDPGLYDMDRKLCFFLDGER